MRKIVKVTGKLPHGTSVRYVTRVAHGSHPAGEECLATRVDEITLRLQFDNGDVMEDFHTVMVDIEGVYVELPFDAALWLSA